MVHVQCYSVEFPCSLFYFIILNTGMADAIFRGLIIHRYRREPYFLFGEKLDSTIIFTEYTTGARARNRTKRRAAELLTIERVLKGCSQVDWNADDEQGGQLIG